MAHRIGNTKINRKIISQKAIIALILMILIGVGIILWYYFKNDGPTTPAGGDPSNTTSTNPPTQSITTEGKVIEVPSNVDPSSIKNYELITENETFKIRKLDNQYVVTLYPIVNRPDEQSYTNQLRQFKQDALDYLTKSGLNVKSLSITYDPPKAAEL